MAPLPGPKSQSLILSTGFAAPRSCVCSLRGSLQPLASSSQAPNKSSSAFATLVGVGEAPPLDWQRCLRRCVRGGVRVDVGVGSHAGLLGAADLSGRGLPRASIGGRDSGRAHRPSAAGRGLVSTRARPSAVGPTAGGAPPPVLPRGSSFSPSETAATAARASGIAVSEEATSWAPCWAPSGEDGLGRAAGSEARAVPARRGGVASSAASSATSGAASGAASDSRAVAAVAALRSGEARWRRRRRCVLPAERQTEGEASPSAAAAGERAAGDGHRAGGTVGDCHLAGGTAGERGAAGESGGRPAAAEGGGVRGGQGRVEGEEGAGGAWWLDGAASDGFGGLRRASEGFRGLRRVSDGFGGLRRVSDGKGEVSRASAGGGGARGRALASSKLQSPPSASAAAAEAVDIAISAASEVAAVEAAVEAAVAVACGSANVGGAAVVGDGGARPTESLARAACWKGEGGLPASGGRGDGGGLGEGGGSATGGSATGGSAGALAAGALTAGGPGEEAIAAVAAVHSSARPRVRWARCRCRTCEACARYGAWAQRRRRRRRRGNRFESKISARRQIGLQEAIRKVTKEGN